MRPDNHLLRVELCQGLAAFNEESEHSAPLPLCPPPPPQRLLLFLFVKCEAEDDRKSPIAPPQGSATALKATGRPRSWRGSLFCLFGGFLRGIFSSIRLDMNYEICHKG